MEVPAQRSFVWSEKAPIRHLDPTLLTLTIGLATWGLLMVYSATRQSQAALGGNPGLYLKKQILALVIGLIAMVAVAVFDYRLVKVYSWLGFGLLVFLLFVVLTPIGTTVAGAQRWISLGGFQFQPSEMAKLGLVAVLAAYLSELRSAPTLREVWRATAIACAPMFFLFLQPDIGTMLVFAAILVAMLVGAGTRGRHIGILAIAALVAIFAVFQTGLIKEYQRDRLIGFLDPASDLTAAGYNRAQSEIAIGNGGVAGQGFLNGSQTSLDFVPEQHTDFIFTVVGEELGFLGAMGLLGLFALLFWRGYRIALLSKDPFGTYLAIGITTMLAFQLFVNVGMTMGIMPITGIPLPFVSYGGSALITNCLAVGMLLNVHMRRFK